MLVTMPSLKTALIMVGVQNDYLSGTMAVPDAENIIPGLVKVASEVDLVIAGREWHPADHYSFAMYPPHCVQDTKGARMPAKIRKLAHYVVSMGMDKQQDAFSLFAGHTLRPKSFPDKLLKAARIERVIIGGLPMEVNVRYTAHDAAALGLVTIVGLDITRSMTPVSEGEALAALNRSGVLVQNVAS